MKLCKKVLILLLMVSLLLPSMAFAKDNVKIAKVLDFSGDVQMKKGGGEKQFKVFKNMALTQGDTIITGRDGKTTIELDKDKEVSIGPDTQLLISELVSSIKAESGKTSLNLLGGKVMVKIKEKLKGDSKFEIKTPTSVMGVRGTMFYVNVDPVTGNTYMGVFDGIVAASNRSNQGQGAATEELTLINPNQQMSFDGTSSTVPRPAPLNIDNIDSFGLEELANEMETNPDQINIPDLINRANEIRSKIEEKRAQETQARQQREQLQHQQRQDRQQRVSHTNPAQPAPAPTPAPPVVNEPDPGPVNPPSPPVEEGPKINGPSEITYELHSEENVYVTLINGENLENVAITINNDRYYLRQRINEDDDIFEWDYYLDGTDFVVSHGFLLYCNDEMRMNIVNLELEFTTGETISLTIYFDNELQPIELLSAIILEDQKTVEFSFNTDISADPYFVESVLEYDLLYYTLHHSQYNNAFLPISTVNSISDVQVKDAILTVSFTQSFTGDQNQFLFDEQAFGDYIITDYLIATGRGQSFEVYYDWFMEAIIFKVSSIPSNNQIYFKGCKGDVCDQEGKMIDSSVYEVTAGISKVHIEQNPAVEALLKNDGNEYVKLYTMINGNETHLFNILFNPLNAIASIQDPNENTIIELTFNNDVYLDDYFKSNAEALKNNIRPELFIA